MNRASVSVRSVSPDPEGLGFGNVFVSVVYDCPDLEHPLGSIWCVPEGDDAAVLKAIRDCVIRHDHDRFKAGVAPCSCCVGIWRRYVERDAAGTGRDGQ